MQAYDALIIGGGPAGLSCALELSASAVSCVVVEKKEQLGGQLFDCSHGFPNLVTGLYSDGADLAAKMQEVARAYKCPHKLLHNVDSLDLQRKTIQANGREITAKCIVIATGQRARRHPADEGHFPDQVLYMFASADYKEAMRDRHVVIVGGGDSAVCLAIDLREVYQSLHIVNRRPHFHCRADLLSEVQDCARTTLLTNSEVSTIGGGDHLEYVVITDKKSGEQKRLSADYLACKIGYAPNTELVAGQLDMDESGRIRIAADGATSVAGVFAAGDITNPGYDRIGVAIGQGMLAAAGVRRYLGQI